MRGIILAGGTGSRLGPLTKTINKHLLPVGDVPMIFHPLRVLRDNGITDITVVSSPSGVGQIASLLGSGHEHGCTFTYRVQDQPGGVAQALLAAKRRDTRDMAVILGDNVFWPAPTLINWHITQCFLYEINSMKDLQNFGVAQFDVVSHPDMPDCGRKFIHKIIEKPTEPPSLFAVTGVYLFPSTVWNTVDRIQAGERGEIEITDLLNEFALRGQLEHNIITGFWGDAGTFEGMAECSAVLRGK